MCIDESLLCEVMLAALVRDPLPGRAALVVGWQQLRQRGRPTGQQMGADRATCPADGGALMGANRCICMLYSV